jgi:hypothetical protein
MGGTAAEKLELIALKNTEGIVPGSGSVLLTLVPALSSIPRTRRGLDASKGSVPHAGTRLSA